METSHVKFDEVFIIPNTLIQGTRATRAPRRMSLVPLERSRSPRSSGSKTITVRPLVAEISATLGCKILAGISAAVSEGA